MDELKHFAFSGMDLKTLVTSEKERRLKETAYLKGFEYEDSDFEVWKANLQGFLQRNRIFITTPSVLTGSEFLMCAISVVRKNGEIDFSIIRDNGRRVKYNTIKEAMEAGLEKSLSLLKNNMQK